MESGAQWVVQGQGGHGSHEHGVGVQPVAHLRLYPQVRVDRAQQPRRELGAGCPVLDQCGLPPHPVGGHPAVGDAAAHTGEAPHQPAVEVHDQSMAEQIEQSASSCDQGYLVTGVGQQGGVDRSDDTCPEHSHMRHGLSPLTRHTQKCRNSTGGRSG